MKTYKRTNSIIEQVYSFCLALMLPLHVFNVGSDDGIKPFHFPAILACVLSVFFLSQKGSLFKWFKYFFIFSLLSSLLSFFNGSFREWLKLFVVIYSCFGLAVVGTEKMLKWLSIFIPITLLILLASSITAPQYRFQGFYHDPNYLCTTLFAFLFVSSLIFVKTDSKPLKIIQVISIVIIYYLLLLTLSRTGFLCGVLFLLLVALLNRRKLSFKHIILVPIVILVAYSYSSEYVNESLSNLYERSYGEKSNIESGSETRSLLSIQNIIFILDNPQYIPLGLGTGGVKPFGASQIPGLLNYRKSDGQDHNSWTSCFSEHGLIAFIFYFLIYVQIFKGLKSRKKSSIKYIAFSTFLSIVLFSFSIYENTYLPYWWLMLFLNNSDIYKTRETL